MSSFNQQTYPTPGNASFTEDNASAELTYKLEPDSDDPVPHTLDDVIDKVKLLIGYTDTAVSVGRVVRTLPTAHPIFPNLVVTNCRVSPVGFEPSFSVSVSDPDDLLEAVPLPDATNWGTWQFDLTFGPRPYPMIGDSFIERVDDQWIDEDNAPQPFSYYPEWLRYCVFTRTPREEYIKARHGQVRFRRQGGSAPDGVPYSDFPRVLLPDDILIVKFFRVPYRWIRSADSLLFRFRNYVNQFAWEGFEPGQILYRGFRETRINPPFPELDEDWGGALFGGVFAIEALADIELEFWITNRPATDPPTPTNDNWITNHWNCQTNLFHRRRWFYASFDNPDPDQQAPFFNSAPIPHCLFNDPDAGLVP